MRKRIASVLLTAVLLLSVVISASAQQEKVNVYENQNLIKSVIFVIGLDEYFVNDQVPGVKMDARPFIQDGRTFVPVRFLGNALGVPNEDITWDEQKRKVSLIMGVNSLSMVIGKKEIVTNCCCSHYIAVI